MFSSAVDSVKHLCITTSNSTICLKIRFVGPFSEDSNTECLDWGLGNQLLFKYLVCFEWGRQGNIWFSDHPLRNRVVSNRVMLQRIVEYCMLCVAAEES